MWPSTASKTTRVQINNRDYSTEATRTPRKRSRRGASTQFSCFIFKSRHISTCILCILDTYRDLLINTHKKNVAIMFWHFKLTIIGILQYNTATFNVISVVSINYRSLSGKICSLYCSLIDFFVYSTYHNKTCTWLLLTTIWISNL